MSNNQQQKKIKAHEQAMTEDERLLQELRESCTSRTCDHDIPTPFADSCWKRRLHRLHQDSASPSN